MFLLCESIMVVVAKNRPDMPDVGGKFFLALIFVFIKDGSHLYVSCVCAFKFLVYVFLKEVIAIYPKIP